MRFKTTRAISAASIVLGIAASIPALGDSIAITYNFAGNVTGPPVLTGTTLMVNGLATGSVVSDNPNLNTVWNPVTFHTQNVIDITNGLNNGSFSMMFANGDMLSGNLFEDDSQVLATNTGPFTQTLTFTGGTGEFAGATGSVSGGGLIGTSGFTTSGRGTLDAPEIPEPGSAALFLGGLAVVLVRLRKRKATSRLC